MYSRDTIAAIATPLGKGGVGIIRVSGEKALLFSEPLFRPKVNRKSFKSSQMYYGDFLDISKDVIDSGYFVWFKNPKTFTGEDVVEFHCHGGVIVLQTLLKSLFSRGIRPAQPGEFSKRAFLNGKLDLVQAESISDLISAGSEKAAEIARAHYQGKLSATLETLRGRIAGVIAWMEAEIDYPDAELDYAGREGAVHILEETAAELEGLALTYQEGKLYTEGVATVILGKPNVGKSSLLNSLAGEDRAIVTDIPGTTRDVLEVPVTIRGIPLRLADTAGIRESLDKIEKIGIEKARKLAAQAELTLLVIDASRPLTREDYLLLDTVNKEKTVVLLNKVDLAGVVTLEDIAQRGFPYIQPVSVLREKGLNGLKETIEGMFTSGYFQQDTTLVTNRRHLHSIECALELLRKVLAHWGYLPIDLLVIDLRDGWKTLGEITGSVWTEDLLDCIFERFCLGK